MVDIDTESNVKESPKSGKAVAFHTSFYYHADQVSFTFMTSMAFPVHCTVRFLWVCLLASLPVSGQGGKPPQSVDKTARSDGLRLIGRPTIERNPNPRVPLAAIVKLTTDRPVSVNLEISDGNSSWLVSYDNEP